MKRKRDVLNENLYGYRYIDPYYLKDEYICYNELNNLVKVHYIKRYVNNNPEQILVKGDRNMYLTCKIISF